MVGGRTVEVDVALSQDDARSLAQGKGAAIASKDNRNMYLVRCSLLLLFAHLLGLTIAVLLAGGLVVCLVKQPLNLTAMSVIRLVCL